MAERPLIGTPAYGDMVHTNYAQSLARMNPVPDLLMVNCSLITIGRTAILSRFLQGDWTGLFFIDSDVGWTPEAFDRVLNSGFDICAAPYPKRKEGAGYPINPAWVGEIDENGFAPCQNVATGFTYIKRHVFERMLEAGFHKPELFDTHYLKSAQEYLSEDIAFCSRWRGLGGQIHIDTRSDITHMGTKEFSASFREYLNGN